MKRIIDISDTDMNKVNHSNRAFYLDVYKIMAKTIQNGTPLDDVLDKIRAEIKENINYNKKMNYQGIVAGLLLALDIIDNHISGKEQE